MVVVNFFARVRIGVVLAAIFFPLQGEAQTKTEGIAVLNSARGNEPRNVVFQDISWPTPFVVTATGIDGESTQFEQAEITRILYFDQAQYDRMDADQRYLMIRAGIQTRETIVESKFPNVQSDIQLAQVQTSIAKLRTFEERFPTTTDQLTGVITSLSGIISRYQSGEREVAGEWMTIEEYQSRFVNKPVVLNVTTQPTPVFQQPIVNYTPTPVPEVRPPNLSFLTVGFIIKNIIINTISSFFILILCICVGVGKRFAASWIDNYVLWILTFMLVIAMGIPLPDLDQHVTSKLGPAIVRFYVAFLAAAVLVTFLYYAIFDCTGGTIGRQVMGIWVVTLDGKPISLFRSIVRSLARLFSIFICFLGLPFALFSAEKRTLHDYLADTMVVEK